MMMILTAISCTAMLGALAMAFLYAPVEANMGIVQKIFYFHVPAAYTAYLAWGVCTAASIGYLVKRTEKWDTVARSAAELALLFAVIVMITGPLWGRKSWGAYWTWDPRLTAMLLFTMIIAAYVLLRALSTGDSERRFAAALSILGAAIVPVISISVRKWRGQHPSVLKGGDLHPDMGLALGAAMVAFTLLFMVLLIRRVGLEKSRQRLAVLEEDAIAKGLWEGER